MATKESKQQKTVATPNEEHAAMRFIWERLRAIVAGEAAVKNYDYYLRRFGTVVSSSYRENLGAPYNQSGFTSQRQLQQQFRGYGQNLLIPFSPNMSVDRYDFYRSEARFLGFTGDFVKSSIGAMLRKEPELEFPDGVPEGALDWIRNEFTSDKKPLISFLDDAIFDHIVTGNTWIWVDYWEEEIDGELVGRPIPTFLMGESVINWRVGDHPISGKEQLLMLVVKTSESSLGENEFHDDYKDVVRVHDIDEKGHYRLRRFEQTDSGAWEPTLLETPNFAGKPLMMIPVFPLSGSAGLSTPFIQNFADAEVGHYNANSRRNHLLYGSASYTPVVSADLTEEDTKAIEDAGIGGIWFLPKEASATALSTPTDALKDLEKAIETEKDNMAKLGSRALAREVGTRESGTALDIRNSTASATLASASRRLASNIRQVITFMVNWQYKLEIDDNDVKFTLSTNFVRNSAGEGAVMTAFEFWKAGIISKETLTRVAADNDFLPADFDATMEEAAVTDEVKRTPESVAALRPTQTTPLTEPKEGDE